MCSTKVCIKCGDIKNVEMFPQKRGTCNLCKSKLYKEYSQKNREKIYLVKKEWKRKNREKINLNNKKYYQNHKDKIIECFRIYKQNNKEKVLDEMSLYVYLWRRGISKKDVPQELISVIADLRKARKQIFKQLN